MIKTLKRLRDDILLWRYVANVPESFATFLDAQHQLRGKNLALVVAFEQPWILEIMLRKFEEYVSDFQVVVFDNSRNSESREQIAEVCGDLSVTHFGLPANAVRHPNRSHGMAMTWIYHNFVSRMQPGWFGFLDHDLIAMRPVDYRDRLFDCLSFGRRVQGFDPYWYLWAGYSFFRFDLTASNRVNFLNDFSRNLDTGGRNWDPIYARLTEQQVKEVTVQHVYAQIPGQEDFPMQFLDSAWLHIGGVGHRSPEKRKMFYAALKKAFRTNDFSSETFCLKTIEGGRNVLD